MPAPIRVGLMVPENNTTIAHEMLAWLPPGSSIDLNRIPRGKEEVSSFNSNYRTDGDPKSGRSRA
jgi:hypothetical protein